MTASPQPAESTHRLPAVPTWARMIVLAGVLTILAWPIANLRARATLDGSWQIALHLAAGLGLQHGVDFIFTYGPLGFLGFPQPYLDATSAIALIFSIVVYVALIGTMLVEARRLLPLWAAFVVTLLVARIFALLPPFEAFQALIFIWCVEALADRIRLPTLAIAAIGGVLAGAALLGKVNVGIFAVAMVGVTIVTIGRPWGRSIVVYVVATVASGLAFWLATGQHLANLGAYASGVFEVISGYNGAMGADPVETRRWLYLALPAVAGLLIWTGWLSSRAWPRRRRIGLAILAVVFGFAMWKLAVVREHVTFVFATAVVAMFPFAMGVERRTWLASTLAIGLAFAGSSAMQPKTYLELVGSTRSIVNEVRHSFLPGWTERAAQRTQDRLRSWYLLDPSTLAAIGTETVHFDPVMASAAYAYPDLHWLPLPTIQSYTAYTPALDRLDAGLLRSPDGPQRILRNVEPAPQNDRTRLWIDRPFVDGEFIPTTVDGRFRWFESPLAMLETFCRYDQISATERWQVLGRTDRSCGPAESLGTVSARAGETVTIPVETRPGRFVTVKIDGLEPSSLGRVRDALYRPPDWYVKLDDTRYRLIPGTAGDGLLVAVPPSADGTGHFAFGAPIRTMTVTRGERGHDSQAPLTFTFESMPRSGS
jgi:hypothetical protein